MAGYMLISVYEREISSQQFKTFQTAREQMMDELESEFCKSDFYPNDDGEMWDQIASHNEFREYEGEDNGFAFGEIWAWSNLDKNSHCDWKIVGID